MGDLFTCTDFRAKRVTPSGRSAALVNRRRRICSALKARGVVPDFRAPDLIRLAPSPLYTGFADCAEAIGRLKQIALTRAYEKYPLHRALVT